MTSAETRYAVDPETAKSFDTAKLREHFHVGGLFAPGEIKLVYSHYDRLILGSIPDIGFAGDEGLHGPKRYNWHQLVGSLKFTLLRLQERIVGKGPAVPQVPVAPSPTEPGEIVTVAPEPPR